MGRRGRAAVVVLGDIGRSPRMQYHALSLARQASLEVDIVAYGGSEPHPMILENPSIHVHKMTQWHVVPKSLPKILYPFMLLLKPIIQFIMLLWFLCTKIPAPDVYLVQDQEKRGDANGISMTVMHVSKTIAPTCGGALIQKSRKGSRSPDIFLAAAKRFKSVPVDPQFALVFEDAPSEVGAAKNAGMLDSSYVGAEYQVLTSLLEFDPTEWGLPPFEDLEA